MSHFDYLKSIHSNLKRLTVLLTIGYTPEAVQTVKDIVSNTISNAPDNIRLDIEGYYPGLSQEHFRTTVKKILVKLITMQMQSASDQLKDWPAYQQFNNVANSCNDLRIPHDMLSKIEQIKDAGKKIKALHPAISKLVYNQMAMELNKLVPGDTLSNMTLFSGLTGWYYWSNRRAVKMLDLTLDEMMERVSFVSGMLADPTKIPHGMLRGTQFQNLISATGDPITRKVSSQQLHNIISAAESTISDENNLSLVQKLMLAGTAASKQVLDVIDVSSSYYARGDIKTLLNNTVWSETNMRVSDTVGNSYEVNGWLDKIYAKTARMLECDSGIMGKLSAELVAACTKDSVDVYTSLVKLYAVYIHNIEDYHNAMHVIQRLGRVELGTGIMAINALSAIILTAIYKYTKDGSMVEPMTYHATMTQEGFFDMFKKRQVHKLNSINELTDDMLQVPSKVAGGIKYKYIARWLLNLGYKKQQLDKNDLFDLLGLVRKDIDRVCGMIDACIQYVSSTNDPKQFTRDKSGIVVFTEVGCKKLIGIFEKYKCGIEITHNAVPVVTNGDGFTVVYINDVHSEHGGMPVVEHEFHRIDEDINGLPIVKVPKDIEKVYLPTLTVDDVKKMYSILMDTHKYCTEQISHRAKKTEEVLGGLGDLYGLFDIIVSPSSYEYDSYISSIDDILHTLFDFYTANVSTKEYLHTIGQEGFFDMFKKKKDHEASGESIELDNISELTDEMLTPEHRIQIRANREAFKELYYTWAVCIGHVETNLTKTSLFNFIDHMDKVVTGVHKFVDTIFSIIRNTKRVHISSKEYDSNKEHYDAMLLKPTGFIVDDDKQGYIHLSSGYTDVFAKLLNEHAIPVRPYLRKSVANHQQPIFPVLTGGVSILQPDVFWLQDPDVYSITLDGEMLQLKLPDSSITLPVLSKPEVIELYKKIISVGKKIGISSGKLEDMYYALPDNHTTDPLFEAISSDEKYSGMLYLVGEFLESLFHVYAKDVYTQELHEALNTGILDK